MESFQDSGSTCPLVRAWPVSIFLFLMSHCQFIYLPTKVRHLIRDKVAPRVWIPKFNTHRSSNDKQITSGSTPRNSLKPSGTTPRPRPASEIVRCLVESSRPTPGPDRLAVPIPSRQLAPKNIDHQRRCAASRPPHSRATDNLPLSLASTISCPWATNVSTNSMAIQCKYRSSSVP